METIHETQKIPKPIKVRSPSTILASRLSVIRIIVIIIVNN